MTYLENESIRLRALEPEDLDVLYRWENDSRLWKFGSTIAPYSKFALREYISESRHDIFQSRQLRLMVVLKENNTAIGTIDLYDFDPMNSRAGVGILIDVGHRRKGIGKQVLDLIKNYAFDFLMVKQLYAYVPKKNKPSISLFTNCDYVDVGCLQKWVKTSDGFEDVFMMQLVNPNESI